MTICVELQQITEEIEMMLKTALTQLDKKFEQKLKQIEQNVEQNSSNSNQL